MTSFCDSYDYYKKMLQLQERLRKSEEERIRLEERFKMLIQEYRNRHDACINRLRLRYIEFLEEQRMKDEKNHKFLETLDRVDNSLALMTAKTDRLNILKKQYEGYLHRIYAIRSLSENVINDSNVTKQSKNTNSRKNIAAEDVHLSSEVKSISSAQIYPLNRTNRSISPSTLKLTRNKYYDDYQRNITPSEIHQQAIEQNSIQQLPVQNFSSQFFQRKLSYFQIDPNVHVSHVSPNPCLNLSPQTLPYLHKSMARQMETVQVESDFVLPKYTNTNVSQYKLLSASQSQSTSKVSPYVNPLSDVHSFQQQSNRASLNDTQTRMKNMDEISLDRRFAPIITERKIPTTFSSNVASTLPKQPYVACSDNLSRNYDYLQRSISDTSAYSSTISNIDDTRKWYKYGISKNVNGTGLSPSVKQTFVEENESRTAEIIENELDRYINKIRKLHDLDVQSSEKVDHEQNVNGDILNVTSSNNDLKQLIDRLNENLPKEVEKVLALADDLASRTVDLNDTDDFGKGQEDENRNLDELVRVTHSDIPISERNHATYSSIHEGRETSVTPAKDKISSNIALHEPKLDTHQNIEYPEKLNSSSLNNTHALEQDEQLLPKPEENEEVVFSTLSNDKDMEHSYNTMHGDMFREGYYGEGSLYTAKESKLDQYLFDVVEELKPWNLDFVKKNIKEINLTHKIEDESDKEKIIIDISQLNEDNIKEVEAMDEIETAKCQMDKQDFNEDANMVQTDLGTIKDQLNLQTNEYLELDKDSMDKSETDISKISASHNEKLEYEDNYMNNIQNIELSEDKFDKQKELANIDKKEDCYETNQILDINQSNKQEITIQSKEHNDQNYIKEPNEAQNYVPSIETEYSNLNEEYNYDQNMSYESNQDQNYNQNMSYESNQDQNYNQNVPYENNQDQNYNQNVSYESNRDQEYQEYVQESNEQYEGYTNKQYDDYTHDSENQYEPVSNVQYQEDFDQQHNLNQISETNVTESLQCMDTYNFTQAEIPQEEEGDTQNQKYKQSQETSDQEIEKPLEKFNESQSESIKLPIENEPNKKKDIIKSLLNSDTDSTIERNVSNTESDFDFN